MTGTIIKRPNGKYGARVWDADLRKRVWVGTFESRREAQKAIIEFYARPRVGNALTCQQLADKWLSEGAQQKNWRESTKCHNTERVKRFLKEHGSKRAKDVRVSEALTWAVEHPRELPALRAMFGYGRLIEAVASNPFAELNVSRPKPKRHRIALTEDQVAKLAKTGAELHGPWMEAAILFSSYTALRAGEMFALKYADLGHDELTVRRSFSSKTGQMLAPKNGHERTVIFPPIAREAVTRMPRRPGQEFVFVNPRDGNHLTATSLAYYWYSTRATAGWPDLTWHELRHTALTILLARGCSAEDVALQAGHVREDGSPDPTLIYKVYGHPSRGDAMRRLKQAFAGPTPLRTVTDLSQEAGEAR